MIARMWRGSVQTHLAQEYLAHQAATGIRDYKATAGNRGAVVLSRELPDRVEIVVLSFWDSLEDVRAFAGHDVESARFYPGDARFFVTAETVASHWTVADLEV